MQLIIARSLLEEIRSSGRAYGVIHCDVVAHGVLLARKLRCGSEIDYADLAVNEVDLGVQIDLTWIAADPPLDSSPMDLKPRLPLGAQKLAAAPPQPDQPYLKTLFQKQKRLLVVGGTSARLLLRRAFGASQGALWWDGTVTEVPPRMTDTGISPALKGRSIGVIGLGSIGGRVAQLLAAAGTYKLVLVDPDSLEIRNLRRHLVRARYLGTPKAMAIKAHLEEYGFDVKCETFVHGVPREDSLPLRQSLAECDALACCADSGPAQQYVNHFAWHAGLPAVISSIKLMPQALGEAVLVKPKQAGCLNCWRLALERDGLMMRSRNHDLADYPGPAEETPHGMPAYLLDQIAATTVDLVARSRSEPQGRIWLNAMEVAIDNFEDLEVQQPTFQAIEPISSCLVCGK